MLLSIQLQDFAPTEKSEHVLGLIQKFQESSRATQISQHWAFKREGVIPSHAKIRLGRMGAQTK